MSKLIYTKEYVSDGNKFYWDPDTLEYYKNAEWREIWNYVKNECHLEDGETYEMLANDLMAQTRN